ncbi:MAG: LamG-like jellyroll fold domain-containing protein, partial [Rhodothermales bacterium]|nr:LamG-like jellyroll fold domain-containing protein [Rhodothermales bacterium]
MGTILERWLHWMVVAGLGTWGLSAVPERVPDALALTVTVDDANPGLEELRSDCVTISAGPGAIQCDDYLYAYTFPSVWRMSRERSLSLVYNTALAYSRSVLGANVTIPAAHDVETVRARLIINSATVDSTDYDEAEFARDQPTRIAFDHEEPGTSGDAIIPFTIEIETYNSSQASTGTADASGHYLNVDRSDDFGRGWWVSGYERVVPDQVGDTLLWIGGDGSAAAYEPTPTAGKWARVARGRPDTISYYGHALDLDGTEYAQRDSTEFPELMGETQMTWAFWLKTSNSGRIFGISANEDPHRVWWFETDDVGKELRTVIFNDAEGDPQFIDTPDVFTADTWHFAVVQFDGTQNGDSASFRVWIDDSEVAYSDFSYLNGTPIPDALATSDSADFEVGRLTAYSGGFNGQLGELAIFQAVPTDSERTDWYENGIDFSHANLVAGYRWDRSLTDESSSGYDLSNGAGIDATDYVRATYLSERFTRHLIGGGEVRFDAAGRHERTIDVFGNETWFDHTVVSGKTRLNHIALPMFDLTESDSSQDTVFVFGWDANARLDEVKVQLPQHDSFAVFEVFTTGTPVVSPTGYVIDTIRTPAAPDPIATKFAWDDDGDGILK